MNKRIVVIATTIIVVLGFGLAGLFYDRFSTERSQAASAVEDTNLVRPYSPIIGAVDARVTIVEFFDPSCEACRAFYPVVKQILAQYPKDVRLVVRYTPFHPGSEDAVRILETARIQGLFEPVLESILAAQPRWAAHGSPNLNLAWAAAANAGLDVVRARREASMPLIDAVIKQDMADVGTLGVKQTPTFFVNGKRLVSFGRQQLIDIVSSEVDATRSKSGGRS